MPKKNHLLDTYQRIPKKYRATTDKILKKNYPKKGKKLIDKKINQFLGLKK